MESSFISFLCEKFHLSFSGQEKNTIYLVLRNIYTWCFLTQCSLSGKTTEALVRAILLCALLHGKAKPSCATSPEKEESRKVGGVSAQAPVVQE